jgi:hypothetical protein
MMWGKADELRFSVRDPGFADPNMPGSEPD